MRASIRDLQAGLRAGDLDALALSRASLDAIRTWDGRLNAIRSLDEAQTLAKAGQEGVKVRGGTAAPLAGIPLVIKDNINRKGLSMGCGSRILEG